MYTSNMKCLTIVYLVPTFDQLSIVYFTDWAQRPNTDMPNSCNTYYIVTDTVVMLTLFVP